jgi:hypothetical protein
LLAVNLFAQPKQSTPKDTENTTNQAVNATTSHNSDKPAANKETAKPSPPRWYASSEWWLVIIATLTALAIAYQAREMTRATNVMQGQMTEMRRQVDLAFGQLRAMHETITEMSEQTSLLKEYVGHTETTAVAAKASADAALLSANAWMNGERAWIFSEVHDMKVEYYGGYGGHKIPILISFQFNFTSHGKTPGRIVRSCVNLETVASLEALSPEPIYRAVQDAGPFQTPITTGRFHAVFTALNDTFTEAQRSLVSQGELILCWYGFVDYVDIFDRPHETRFCYKYAAIDIPGTDVPSFGLVKWGHPEYNKAT